MPTNKPGRIILSSIEIEAELDKRMRAAIKGDASLRHVKRPRAPWIRAAIAEKCERQEWASGKLASEQRR